MPLIRTFIDWETAFGVSPSGREVTLSKQTTEEYVRDKEFKAHGLGVQIDNDAPFYLWKPDDLVRFLRTHPWDKSWAIMHHAQFDGAILSWRCGIRPAFIGDTISMARAIYPYESYSLDNLAKVLGLGQKGSELHSFKHMWSLDEEQQEIMGKYCCNDVALTAKIFNALLPHFPVDELRLIDWTIRAFTEPVIDVDGRPLVKAHAHERRTKRQLIKSCVANPKQLSSNDQFAALLMTLGVDPPKKISPSKLKKGIVDQNRVGPPPPGILPKFNKEKNMPLEAWKELKAEKERYPWAYAFGKSDEEFKMLLDHPNEQVQAVVEARMGVKSTIVETRTKRYYKIGKRGKFPVYLNYWGAHCITSDTEVLTEDGWVRIDQWDGGNIAQVHSNLSIEFLYATRFVGDKHDKWIHADNNYLSIAMTDNHNCPYLAHGSKNWKEIPADRLLSRQSSYIPIAGTYLGGSGKFDASMMRVFAMVQADGSYDKASGCLSVFVKKERKKERCRLLFSLAGVRFSEYEFPSHPGFTRFNVSRADIPEWLGADKKYFGSWLLQTSSTGMRAFVNELVYWDGFVYNDKSYYSSSDYINIEWVVTCCHLAGKGTAVYKKVDKRSGNRRPNYTVGIKNRPYVLLKRREVKESTTPMRTYCAQTQTGYWLARRNGNIFVTGNTNRWSGGDKQNAQNPPRVDKDKPHQGALRFSWTAPKGHLVVVRDLGQIEARMLCYWAGQEDMLKVFRDGGDPYNFMASKIYGYEIDRKNNPEHKKHGMVGKVVTLGSGYGMGFWKLQESVRVGFMGMPGMLFDDEFVQQLHVDIEAFKYRRSYHPDFQYAYQQAEACKPLNIDLDTHIKHCAVTAQLIDTYRTTNANVTALWRECQDALGYIIAGMEVPVGARPLIHTDREGLVYPNGMKIRYHQLRKNSKGEYKYLSNRLRHEYSYIYGGRSTENGTQGLSRLVISDQLLRVDQRLKKLRINPKTEVAKVASSTHDELITVAPERYADEVLEMMAEEMRTPPAWCPDLPLKSSGGWASNYGDCEK